MTRENTSTLRRFSSCCTSTLQPIVLSFLQDGVVNIIWTMLQGAWIRIYQIIAYPMALTLTNEALAAGIGAKIGGTRNSTLDCNFLLLFFLVFLEFLKKVSLLQHSIRPPNQFLFHFFNLQLHLILIRHLFTEFNWSLLLDRINIIVQTIRLVYGNTIFI